MKSRLLTWAAEARRALPAPRPALATGGTLAFVHSAFWRDATGEEGYIAPVLDALAGDAARRRFSWSASVRGAISRRGAGGIR